MIFCGLIKRTIQVSACPLLRAECMWKHTKTAECCFTTDKLTKEQYCELVGLEEIPSKEELEQRLTSLQNLISKDIYDEDSTTHS